MHDSASDKGVDSTQHHIMLPYDYCSCSTRAEGMPMSQAWRAILVGPPLWEAKRLTFGRPMGRATSLVEGQRSENSRATQARSVRSCGSARERVPVDAVECCGKSKRKRRSAKSAPCIHLGRFGPCVNLVTVAKTSGTVSLHLTQSVFAVGCIPSAAS